MRIVALADLHGRLPDVPECDVLLLPGDICPDFPFYLTYNDGDLARTQQMNWLSTEYYEWEQRVPAKHILATPGNHDWIVQMPEHCKTRLFIDRGDYITVENGVTCVNETLSFWFTPWIIPVGSWNYMASREFRKRAFADIPARVDVLVSHTPPHRVGDRTWGNDNAGCPELRSAIQTKRPRHVFFGHIHEGFRDGKLYRLGNTELHHSTYFEKSPIEVFDIESA